MTNLETSAPSSTLSPGFIAGLVLLILVGLFFSRPTAAQFYRQVWTTALYGMKAEIQQQAQNNPTSTIVESVLSRVPLLMPAIRASNNAELDTLPAFWMDHTTVYDWKLLTYFRYDEKDCFSDYIGIAGTLVNLGDGCKIEPFRAKGGAL